MSHHKLFSGILFLQNLKPIDMGSCVCVNLLVEGTFTNIGAIGTVTSALFFMFLCQILY
jgi:hypothetical protein